ncbi:hypothetical protein OAO87_03050 [bacterium]|nr:hypothetical protein [bacterium]
MELPRALATEARLFCPSLGRLGLERPVARRQADLKTTDRAEARAGATLSQHA